MIRIFHTADWHLGQVFHGYDRDYEHAKFLDWLLETIAERKPHGLLISGDIHDTINPSATALSRFYSFLSRAHALAPEMQTVLIAGNHDAAARLEAPSTILESLNIRVVGTVGRDSQGEIDVRKFLVPLRGEGGEVQAIALAVPFLRPSDVPLVKDARDPHLDGIRELYRRALEEAERLREERYPGASLVALGHCHMQGAAESRFSERPIVIGGAEALLAETFATSLTYVALGHLHKPQEIEEGRIFYSGSPLPLSFSELEYEHRILELDLAPGVPAAVTSRRIPVACRLLRIPADKPAPLAEVLAQLETLDLDDSLPPGAHPFLEVRVLNDGPDPTRRTRIREVLEGKPVRLAVVREESPARATTAPGAGDEDELPDLCELDSIRPEEILETCFQERYNASLPADLREAFREILAASQIAQGEEAPAT